MDLFTQSLAISWWQWLLIWIVKHHIELIATLTGVVYLIYSIRSDNRLWIYGFISSALYVYICYNSQIYADMGINIYYVVISIYGWIHWTIYNQKTKHELPYSSANNLQWLWIISIIAVFFFAIGLFLDRTTDSDIPYWDAFTTSAGIVATWMLARKIIEHWIIWIAVDSVSIGLYMYKELYPTAILFGLYTILAVSGYLQWKNAWKKQVTGIL